MKDPDFRDVSQLHSDIIILKDAPRIRLTPPSLRVPPRQETICCFLCGSTVARSDNGINCWHLSSRPPLMPSPQACPEDIWGLSDYLGSCDSCKGKGRYKKKLDILYIVHY